MIAEMYDDSASAVLRCEECNKPFDKPSTLKRHRYYCRSRKSGSTIRARSCLLCAKTKSRCDNRRPDCSRCSFKGIQCHYPGSPSTNEQKPPQVDGTVSSTSSPATGVDILTSDDAWQLSNEDASLPSLDIPDIDLETFGLPDLDWDQALQNFDPDSIVASGAQRSHAAAFAIPLQPTEATRSLVRRDPVGLHSNRAASMISATMKSYPLMLHNDALPPFIHPSVLSLDLLSEHMEPITDCINLTKMISNGFRGSHKLFWKNVRHECERLCSQHAALDRWELLAALQAMFIYTLTRLDEGENEDNNVDALMLRTVTVLSIQLNGNAATQSALFSNDFSTGWQDWIFDESIRRLCVIYQIVNMLVHFEPASICKDWTDLVLARLPSSKQLWEAADETSWRAATERLEAREAFGMAANGQLMRLGNGQSSQDENMSLTMNGTGSRVPAKWEDWCAGMDSFGGLVVLAAAM